MFHNHGFRKDNILETTGNVTNFVDILNTNCIFALFSQSRNG